MIPPQQDLQEQQSNSLGQLAAKGVFWSGLSTASVTGLRFVTIAVLAHFLSPRDFGIVGITYIFLEFMIDIGDLGVGPAIIQRQNTTKELLDTCFWLILINTFVLTGILCGGAGSVALFFNESEISLVLVVSSFSVPIRAAGMIHRSLLQKELAFKSIATADISGTSTFGIISITLALHGFGVWSIVIGLLAHRVVDTIILWCLIDWRPSFKVKLKSFKKVANFSWNVLGERIVYFLSSRLDYLVVQKLLGTSSLGFYTLASEITLVPQKRISSLISMVAFPAFSKVQNDNSMIRTGYLKLIRNVALVTIPMLALLFVVSQDFVKIVYGDKWLASAYPMSILCIAGGLRCIMNSNGSIFYSKGRADIAFKWALVQLVILFPPVIFGAKFGIIGVAAAISITYLLFFSIIQPIVNKLIELPFRKYLLNIRHVAMASACMAITVTLFRLFLKKTGFSPNIIPFLLLVITGILIYSGTLIWVRRDILSEVKSIALRMIGPSPQ